ncbi:MAG: Ig-like domain-containing protein, partial [Erysipelotrichaceae bacterium]|nr:Ig-like domain-containing protein [Erysipelotrichaceae bacterium]
MRRLFSIILTVLLTVTGVLFQNAVIDAETTVTNVAITYDADKLPISKKLTGREVTSLIAEAYTGAGPSARVDTNTRYTYLAKRDGDTYVSLADSNELLNETDDYYLVFNVEEMTGYVFDVDNLPSVTINGTAADLVEWRSDPVPNGDINAYRKVTVTDADWVFSVQISVDSANVAAGTSYLFEASVAGTIDSLNWSIEYQTSSSTHIDQDGRLYVGADEAYGSIKVKAASTFNEAVSDYAWVQVVSEPPYIESVTIDPGDTIMRRGEVKWFEAVVVGTDIHDVKWTLTGNSSIDTHVSSGYVTVGSDEASSSLTLTATSLRDSNKSDSITITVIDAEIIANVAVTYADSEALALTTSKTGAQITEALYSAVNSSAGPSARVDTNPNYTHLAKKDGSDFVRLSSSTAYLNESEEYYFVFNIEEMGGYIFDIENLPNVTINGAAADLVEWRVEPSTTGDINAYKRVYLDTQLPDHVISFDRNGGSGSMANSYVKDGKNFVTPGCGFIAPSGKGFAHWFDKDDPSLKYNANQVIYSVNRDMTLAAQWADPMDAWITDDGVLTWEEYPNAQYYVSGIRYGEGQGHGGASADAYSDLYLLCCIYDMPSGTYPVELFAVGENNLQISPMWTSSYVFVNPRDEEKDIVFFADGEDMVAYRVGALDERVSELIDFSLTPKEGKVFSGWHTDEACTEWLDYRTTVGELEPDENGIRWVYARWADGIDTISLHDIAPLYYSEDADDYMHDYCTEPNMMITADDNDIYYVFEVIGVYKQSGGQMTEYHDAFELGNTYYLKMNIRFLQFDNYRFAYDTVNDVSLLNKFYANGTEIHPIIEDATAIGVIFYVPVSWPQIVTPIDYYYLSVGQSRQLTYEINPENTRYADVLWESSNPSVAEVDSSGKVTGLSAGEAMVYAYLIDGDGYIITMGEFRIVVGDYSIYFEKDEETVVVGKTKTIAVKVDPENHGSVNVKYQSVNPEIATVDSVTGVVKGIKPGKAYIWAQDQGAMEKQATYVLRVLFTDVADSGKYFFDSVYWAFDNGITTGTSSTKFSPNDGCTRGQVVTFLWRLMGSPEPTISNP